MPYKDPAGQRQYAKQHYLANKQVYLDSNNRRRKTLKDYVNPINENAPCADCGVSYRYYAMDFDHLHDKQNLIVYFVRKNDEQ